MNRKRSHSWSEIIAPVSLIVCIFALALAIVGTAAAAAAAVSGPEAAKPPQSAPPAAQVFEGIVTDTQCGAKHSAAVNLAAADCTRVCVHGGERFALVDGDKAYTLEGEPETLKRLAGQRAKITGTLNGTTISVATASTP